MEEFRDSNLTSEDLEGLELLYGYLQRNSVGEPMRYEEALAMLAQIGMALHHAHQQQVIHGGIQSQNALSNVQDKKLLTDSQLRSLILPDKVGDTGSQEISIYRAPEQLGGQASEKGDQYTLACIAYELFTGCKPFMIPSVSTPGTYFRTKSLISPEQLNPALSSHISEAIMKAMSRDPGQRYHDIPAFLMALSASPASKDGDQKEVEATLPRVAVVAPEVLLTPNLQEGAEVTLPRIAAVTPEVPVASEVLVPPEAPLTPAVQENVARTLPRTAAVTPEAPGVPDLSFTPVPLINSFDNPFAYRASNRFLMRPIRTRLTHKQQRVLMIGVCLLAFCVVVGVLVAAFSFSEPAKKLGTVSYSPTAFTQFPKQISTSVPTATIPSTAPALTVLPQNTVVNSTPTEVTLVRPVALSTPTKVAGNGQGKGTQQGTGAGQGTGTGQGTGSGQGTGGSANTPTPTPTPTSTTVLVSLGSFFNNQGIGNGPGQANFDGSGYSYPANQLPSGGQITVNGEPYQFPGTGSRTNDNVQAGGQTIKFTSGHYRQAWLLTSASWGPVNATVTISYTDGSTTTANLTVADWLAGSSSGLQTPYRYGPNTTYQNVSYIYAMSIPVDSTRVAKALILPNYVSGQYQNGRMHVFAVTMEP